MAEATLTTDSVTEALKTVYDPEISRERGGTWG